MIKRFICFAALLLLFAFFSLVVIFTLPRCASTPPTPDRSVDISLSYTTDAMITPMELMRWEAVFVSSVNREGIYYIVSQNPLINTPVKCLVKYILCRVDNNRTRLTAYAYYMAGELFVFQLKTEDITLSTGHFTRVEDLSKEARDAINYYLLRFLDIDRI